MFDREQHVVPYAEFLHVGDRLELVRGNGLDEGKHMGVATVLSFEDHVPVFDIRWEVTDVD